MEFVNDCPTDKVLMIASDEHEGSGAAGEGPLTKSKLIHEQRKDLQICSLFKYSLPKNEVEKVPDGYFCKKWCAHVEMETTKSINFRGQGYSLSNWCSKSISF
ncbi:uncharacterized protein LOC143232869 isoform X1 [Tachypleus tridentatus]|uniref:uncharacterized protein LOC143232869 isoform X1 n=1 Tax=Tachypleus tridentatus TaxID=6853 RepID=UPI003FD52845